MDEASYIEEVAVLLASSALLTQLGFRSENVITYRTVGNHGWVITKPSWTVPVRGGPRNPYDGVNVHFESRGVGDIRVDCELYPRRQSESKEDRASIQPLLDIKGKLTVKLRAAASSRLAVYRPDWSRALESGRPDCSTGNEVQPWPASGSFTGRFCRAYRTSPARCDKANR